MSDRKVAPPPARPAGASSLIRSVRESAAPQQASAPQLIPEPTSVVEPSAAAVPLPAVPASGSGTAEVKMTVTVGEERRARLRTAYTLTHLQEGHRTFSDFISRALDAEVRRLEEKYNGGAEFKTAEQGVTRGRPLGS